jgi:SAM-dependent methyltransferase
VDFYERIADYYDELFPLDERRVEFAESLSLRRRSGSSARRLRVLDVGCSTGALVLELARRGHNVTGIDLDRKMIGIAAQRASAEGLDAAFRVGDMMEIDRIFGGELFDQVHCFGNTLVHLQGQSEIETFLGKVLKRLQRGGCFAGQILNYDRILNEGIEELPTLEGPNVRFERSYRSEPEGKRIRFVTTLIIKATGEALHSETALYPLRLTELEGSLSRSGYRSVRLYRDYDERSYKPDAFTLIFVGERD